MKSPFKRSISAYLILALTLFLIVSCSSDDENTKPINDAYLNIPDNNFEAALIEKGIDSDGIVNQKISKADAEAVHILDLDFSSDIGEISDLTGIEGFVNLTLLSVAGQELETIDLSLNTKLDTLLLLGNYLTSIDISNNPNLLLVDIQSNELHSIHGLSTATKLKKLNLSWNNLEEFSIDNKSIEMLHLSNNLISSFNSNGAINLKNILLTSNELTNVDFSSNTLLETLLISDNKIEHINLDYLSGLTHLYITSNSLTSLNVSNNQELLDLRVDRNPDLTCIKIQSSQQIPTVSKSDYQRLNDNCN
jgi:Leucine-rich repeat (LRR) protein